jgi:glutamate-1-semialdehyde 2,1-aminomutase
MLSQHEYGDDGVDLSALLKTADLRLPGGTVGGYAMPSDGRLVIDHGEGPYIFDRQGRRYVDYVAGAGTLILGHCHPAVVAAMVAQVQKGTIFFGSLTQHIIELANEMVRAIPCAEMIAFATTGSESTLYAMRLARAHTKRQKILKFEGGYHGNHDYAQIGTAPRAPSNYPFSLPDTAGTPEVVPETILVAPYNDLDALAAILREHWRDTAAVIVEPIQRGIPPEPGFLEGLRQLTKQHGVLLIFDEIVTGFRLAYGGAQEYFGVVPDLATYGKIIGGGLALGAVAGPADIILASNPTERGKDGFVLVNGTQHGNSPAAAAGCAMLRELRKPGFYRALNETSATLRAELAEAVKLYELPAVITGIGSLWHIVFADRPPVNHADMIRSDMKRLREFDAALIREGVFVLPGVRRLTTAAHDTETMSLTLSAVKRAAASCS